MPLPNDRLGRWVRANYSAALRQQVYNRLKARGFVPPLPPPTTPGWNPKEGPPPGSAPPATAAPAPAAPPALPTDLAQQLAIDDLLAQERGLPGLYNPQRRALMANTERGLTDSGLFDPTRGLFREQRTPGSENVSYGFGRGFEGQAFRDARVGLASQAAASGTLYSSGRIDAQRRAQRGLTNQRDAALRQFGQQQEQIRSAQEQQLLGIQSQLVRPGRTTLSGRPRSRRPCRPSRWRSRSRSRSPGRPVRPTTRTAGGRLRL